MHEPFVVPFPTRVTNPWVVRGFFLALSLVSLVATAGSAPRAPALAKGATSGVCSGLKGYEIVRSSGSEARCASGSVVTGGSCHGADGGPAADGAGWECDGSGVATAICANLCSNAADAIGACCDGTSCRVTTMADCTDTGGTYRGDDSTCATVSCAVPALGACCFSNGGRDTCKDDTTPTECAALGGTYLGDGIHCDFDIACVKCPRRPECTLP